MVITIKLTVNKQLVEVDIVDGIVSYTLTSDGSPNILMHSLEGEGETIISEIQVEEGDVRTQYEKTYTNMLSGDIVDFSLNDPNGRKYIGQYSDHDPTPSTDYNKYIWRLAQGEQGVSVTSTNTFFYLSTSKVALEGGYWIEETPVWEDGKYTWMKVKTNYSDGTTSESVPVNLTGATGRAVESISQEYYLSSSRVILEGGEWGPEPYSWEKGKYMWTRFKTTYKNPFGEEWTDPILEVAWQAIESIENIREEDKRKTLEALETAQERVVAIEHNLGEMAAEWNFINTNIRMSEEGLLIGDKQRGNYLLQRPDRLDFISNGAVVAYVSNSELWINSGIFTNKLAVGDVNIIKSGANRIKFI